MKNIYQFNKTIYTINELGLIWKITNRNVLRNKVFYWVKKNKLKRLKRGVYSIVDKYEKFELAGKLESPSYVSLSTVLQKEAVVFQYDSSVTSVAQINRNYQVNKTGYSYRKIKDSVLFNDLGLIRKKTYTIASRERAVLDMLYLVPRFYFDNLAKLNWEKAFELVKIYNNKRVSREFNKLYKLEKENVG